MRITRAQCPNCGAALDIEHGKAWVQCSYCGVKSVVSLDHGPPKSGPQEPGVPVIHLTPGRLRGPALPVLLLGLLVLVGGVVFMVVIGAGTGGMQSAALLGNPVLVDADGDGVDDVVVHGLHVGGKGIHLRAYRGSDGKGLWVSDNLLKAGESEIVAAFPDLILAVGAEAAVVGLDARTGKPRFRSSVPERIEAICQREGQPVLLGKNEKLYAMNPATGAILDLGSNPSHQPLDPSPACAAARSDGRGTGGTLIRSLRSDALRSTAGMSVQTVLEFAGVPPYLMLGHRSAGSRVPMVGVRNAEQVVWTSDVPASEPLNAAEGAPDAASMTKDRAFVAYVRTGGKSLRIAGFMLEDGQRLWEAALSINDYPSWLNVVASEQHVFVYTTKGNDGSLRSLNISTGQLEWSVGG